MILNVFDRLMIRNIIPQIQGWNFAHLKEARELAEGLFTEEEERELDFKLEKDETVKWRNKRPDGSPIPQERDIAISEPLQKKIGMFLEQLDRDERLNFEHYSLYEKFKGNYPVSIK